MHLNADDEFSVFFRDLIERIVDLDLMPVLERFVPVEDWALEPVSWNFPDQRPSSSQIPHQDTRTGMDQTRLCVLGRVLARWGCVLSS
jgi:hypothetical protein